MKTLSFSDSIWKIQEQEEEVKRTKLWHLKMFQRHNWSCREKKEEREKNPCLNRAAAKGSFLIAAAADSALKGVAD